MAGWTRMGQSRFKHQPALSHHQERPPVARCGGYDWWHAGTLCKVETNFTHINTFLHKIITPTKRLDKLSMYYVSYTSKNVPCCCLPQSWHFFQTKLFSKPSTKPSTSQSWGFRHEVFLHVLPKSSAAFAGVWTKAPVQPAGCVFLGSENCMTWSIKIKSWYLGYGSQAGQSRDWEVHLSTLDKDSKHGSMKRGKLFSTLNKHSREHHSEIVAATCILLKTSKTSTKKKWHHFEHCICLLRNRGRKHLNAIIGSFSLQAILQAQNPWVLHRPTTLLLQLKLLLGKNGNTSEIYGLYWPRLSIHSHP